MKIKQITKQFSLKQINSTTDGNISSSRNDFTSAYSGPPLLMASKQIESGLLNCKHLPNSKMFYMSNTTISNTMNMNNNNTSTHITNVYNSNSSNQNYESVQCLLSSEAQNHTDSKSLFLRKLSSKKSKPNNPVTKSIQNCEIPTTSSRAVVFNESMNCKTLNLKSPPIAPEYIQTKQSWMDKTKSWLASILRIDRFSCCKQNTHLNICSNFMDYIHSSRRRKQILLVILIISILLLIIVIITMVVLYNQYDESLTTIYGTSSSYSSSEVLMPPVNKLSPMKKTHHPPVLSSIHLPTTYTTDSSSSISNSKTEQQKCKTQKFCLNVSCLQIASIFAERLGRYNRPKSLVNLLDKCSPEQIDEIIKIFYIGDEFHLSNNENSLYRFKQKRLFTLWSYVSDQLQSYVIEDKSRPFLLWTEKLAYLFQNMIDQYMFKRNLTDNMTDNQTGNNPNGQDYEKLLLNSSKHTLNHQSDSNKVTEVNNTSLMYTSVVPKVGTTVPFPFFASTYTVSATKTQEFNEFDNMAMSFHTELEQLNALLQMGNIAFHGLDNVLINVQLHLRVPLFFTAWIARSHTPGLMDSLIPMLENCEQLELPGYEELKKFIPIDSASYPTTSPPSSSSFQPPPLFPSSFSISSSPSFLWNRVHELQNYIHHLGQLAWKARYSHITKRNTTDEVKSLNLSGVLPVLYKIQKLNHLDDQKPVKSQKMTLRDLMQITQHTINFPRYLGKLTSWNHVNVMPRDMQVWVTNVDYYEELGHILQQTSFSELQDYITFAILHKYGGFVDQQIAQLKRKLLKPYAESLGIEQVSYWPFLLDMASPGLKLILQSRWNLGQLNHAVKQFHVEILTPVQALFAKLLNNSMSDTTKCHELSKKISSMKIQLMSHNDHMWMEEFYSELKIQPKQSLLMQLVKFNNFLSRKAISTDLSKLIPDLGLSSGGSKLLQYVESSNILEISVLLLQWPYFMPDLSIPRYLNCGYLWYSVAKIISNLVINNKCFDVKSFYGSNTSGFEQYARKFLFDSNILDHWTSWSKTPNIFQSTLAIEITGRIYKEYLQTNQNQPDSNLPGIFFTTKELFYQWIFQLICPGFDYSNIITYNQVLLNSMKECDAIRTALKASPTFRWLMNCPELSSSSHRNNIGS